MKCTIPEISWHNRDPVLSIDIQPNHNGFYRLASGGTDTHVLIWYMILNDESGVINLELAADLTRHQRAVNAVKWSPNGKFLATADDESIIMLWKLKEDSEPINILDNTNEQDKEIWVIYKILRGHIEDVYDLSWSSNSMFLVSGSVDNTAMLWDINKGNIGILSDHKGFVQGVSWDPKNQFIATLSTDRYLRIFDIQTKKVLNRVFKCVLPVPETDELHGKNVRIFHDDTLQTFYRRLSFSPDGNLLITPSGTGDFDGVVKPMHFTYIFSRFSLKKPDIILPSMDGYTVAVKFSPLLYNLRPHTDSNQPIIPLPYRMIFAIATKSSVYLYDTQQKSPFGLISNIHYTRITDLTWSGDGRILIVSSTDGFCSLITFNENEIGQIYDKINNNSTVVVDAVSSKNKVATEAKNNGEERIKQFNLIPQQIEIRKPRETKMFEQNEMKKVNNSELKSTNASETKSLLTKFESAECSSIFGNTPNGSEIHTATSNDKIENEQECKTPVSKSIIIDKDIISSNDKFESPEKKTLPATPISVRRHPRNQQNSTVSCEGTSIKDSGFLKTFNLIGNNKTEGTINLDIEKKSKQKLLIISNEKNIELNNENSSDAWPTPLELDSNIVKYKFEEKVVKVDQIVGNIFDETNCSTSDIRLVYEDTSIDDSLNENEQETSSIKDKSLLKTPRRVPFKTISTPKSDKKSNAKKIVDMEKVQEKGKDDLKDNSISEDLKFLCDDDSPEPKTGSLNNSSVTECAKTPRRVPFKTISTPKSNKT